MPNLALGIFWFRLFTCCYRTLQVTASWYEPLRPTKKEFLNMGVPWQPHANKGGAKEILGSHSRYFRVNILRNPINLNSPSDLYKLNTCLRVQGGSWKNRRLSSKVHKRSGATGSDHAGAPGYWRSPDSCQLSRYSSGTLFPFLFWAPGTLMKGLLGNLDVVPSNLSIARRMPEPLIL